jgi:hypothetical protein
MDCLALPCTVNPQSETVTDLTNSDRAFVAAFSRIVQRSVPIETLRTIPHMADFCYASRNKLNSFDSAANNFKRVEQKSVSESAHFQRT